MDKESFQARKEIARRKVDQALWVKAMSQSKGDKNEAKKRYVEIRSEQLKEKNVKGGSAEVVKSTKQKEENTKETKNKEKNMNTIFKRLDLWITAVIFILMLGAERYELLPRIENPLIGLRHEFRAQTLPAEETEFLYDDILIVDTEEEFFEEYGSWPLKRKDIAKMVTNLKRLGAEVIALDMIMDFPNGYGEDPILAEALQESGKTMVVSLLNLDTPIWYSLGETRLNPLKGDIPTSRKLADNYPESVFIQKSSKNTISGLMPSKLWRCTWMLNPLWKMVYSPWVTSPCLWMNTISSGSTSQSFLQD